MKKFDFSILLLTSISITTLTTMSCGDSNQSKSKKENNILVTGNKYYDEDDDYFLDSEKWGNVIQQDIDVPPFKAINIVGDVDIELIQSEQYGINIQSNEKAINLYDINVKPENGANVLHVIAKDYSAHKDLVMNPEIQLTIKTPDISAITLDGNIDLDIRNQISLNGNLDIVNKNFGEINIEEIKCPGKIDISNADGDIKIRKAKCDSLFIEGHGSGDIDINVKTDKTDIHNKKSGDIDMKVDCKELTVQNDGKGEIELEGKTNVLRKFDKGLKVKIDTRKLQVEKINM